MNITRSRYNAVQTRTWDRQSKVGDYEEKSADNFTRSVLQRFEPENTLDRAASGLRSSSGGAFQKAIGFGVGAFWLGLGSAVCAANGSTGMAVGLGAAGVGAGAIAVKSALNTGTDYVGYRKVDKAVGGKFRGDKNAAQAFGFAGGIVGGVAASSLGAPPIYGMIPGAVAVGAIGYYSVAELLKNERGESS